MLWKATKGGKMKRVVFICVLLTVVCLSLPVYAETRGYLPDYNVGTVALINTDSNTKITDIFLGGGGPLAATVSYDGTRVYFIMHNAYVVPSVAHAVKVIDTATNAVIGAIPLAGQPARIALNHAGTLGYVTDQANNRVVVIDTVNFTTTGVTIPVGAYPTGIDITPDGSVLYVVNYSGASVSVVDTSTYGVSTIPLPAFSFASDLVVNNAGTFVYVSNPGGSWDAISVIRVATNTLVNTTNMTGGPQSPAISPDDSRLYVPVIGAFNGLRVYDTTDITPAFVADIPFAGGYGVGVRPDGARVYVPSPGTLYVIDAASLTVTTSIPNVGSSYGYGKWIGENFILTVGLSGGGDGTIVGPGLSCVGNTCRGAYAYNSTFDITATAAATSVFSVWIGCSAPNGPVCTITTTADISMTAIFDPVAHVLTVTNDGAGSGTVTSDPIGINCGSDCSEVYAHGQSITLTATAEADSVFGGWSGGGCSGTDICVISITGDVTVTATFDLLNPPPELSTDRGTIGTKLTVTGSGFGAKKGKVLIGGVATKIAKGAWTPTSITGEIKKPLPPGISYDVKLQLKEPKGVAPIIIPGALTMMAPEIGTVLPNTGAEGASITISGNYFGSKKGKVYLGDKKCKVLTWEMNATTGGSTVSFVVPKKMAPGPYNVKVTNKVDSDTLTNGFTIP
jgi:YVTN family beta-propeller protein